jgi:uncharacterized membrane protein YgaE (UPF0421/DUF939 family)
MVLTQLVPFGYKSSKFILKRTILSFIILYFFIIILWVIFGKNSILSYGLFFSLIISYTLGIQISTSLGESALYGVLIGCVVGFSYISLLGMNSQKINKDHIIIALYTIAISELTALALYNISNHMSWYY